MVDIVHTILADLAETPNFISNIDTASVINTSIQETRIQIESFPFYIKPLDLKLYLIEHLKVFETKYKLKEVKDNPKQISEIIEIIDKIQNDIYRTLSGLSYEIELTVKGSSKLVEIMSKSNLRSKKLINKLRNEYKSRDE